MTKKIFTRGGKKILIHRRLSSPSRSFNKASFPLLFITLTLLASLISPVFVQPAAAAPEWPGNNFIADEVYKSVSTNQHYFWLYACFRHADIDKVTPDEMASWDFFEGDTNPQALGAMYPGETASGSLQGTRDCQTESIVKTAFGYLGFTNPREAFCSLDGAEYRDDNKGNYDDCVAGVGDHDWDNNESESKVAASFEKLAGSKRPAFGGAEEYVRAYMTLISPRGCKMTFENTKLYESENEVPGAGGSSSQYAVPVFVPDDDGKLVPRFIQGVGLPNGDSNMAYVATRSGDYAAYQKKDCNEIVNIARANAKAYKDWLASHPDAQLSNEAGEVSTSPDDPTTTCVIEGIGWMICPMVKAIAIFNDSLFGLLEKLLSINPSMFDTSENGGGKATFQTWQAMRDLANVAFVVAFMVIVYSQITSVGISNYGVKKMLPRIVIAAIMVNLSYVFCAIAVDISNIVGTSLHDLLINQTKTLGDETGNNLTVWDEVTSWLLAGGVTTLAVGGAALTLGSTTAIGVLALMVPLAVTALVAALTVVFVLVARQALVIILIVLSPLAFVAYLLPNTEQWFSRWRKTFFSMLLIYPLVALLFGGSQLASAVIRSGADDALVFVLSLVVLVVPLFATPLLLKFSGGLIGRVAGMMNNPNKGPFDRMKKGGARIAERERNRKFGDAVDRTESLRTKAEAMRANQSGGRLRRMTRRAGASALGGATWASGIGNANAIDSEQKDTYAKAGADSAKRNYVADRALEPGSDYAAKVGGSDAAASYVKAYAIQAKQDEFKKDKEAEKALFAHEKRSYEDIGHAITGGEYDAPEKEHIKHAAMEYYFSQANSDGVQEMIDHVAELRQNATGENLEAVQKLQQTAANALDGHGLKPVDLSATELTKMKNGEFTANETERVQGTVDSGKINMAHIGGMDIDEMRRWNKQFNNNPELLAPVEPDKIQATIKAIDDARKDPRINAKFGEREYTALQEMESRLNAQLAVSQSPAGQQARIDRAQREAKVSQDKAAATYGPNI